MLSILCVKLTIKVKVGISENFKVGWYPPQKTGSSHLKRVAIKGSSTVDASMLEIFSFYSLFPHKIK